MTALVSPKDGPTADAPPVTEGTPLLADAPATASTATPETAVGDPIEEPAQPEEVPTDAGRAASGFLHLRVLSDTLDDIMRTRIAVTNRLERAAIEPFAITGHLDGLIDTEAKLRLAMRRQFRLAAPHIRAWTIDTVGLGEPLMARLIGATGDPFIAHPYRWDTEPPDGHECGPECSEARHLIALPSFQRTPRQFLSYCGWGDPTRRRRVGMTAEDAAALGSARIKPLAFVMAEGCVKQTGGATANRATTEHVPSTPTLGGPSEENATAEESAAGLHIVSPDIAATASGSTGQRTGGDPDVVSTASEHAGRRRPSGGDPDVPATANEDAGHHLLICDGDPQVAPTASRKAGRRRSPYRDVYDIGRIRYADEARGWTLGHQHQAAMRLTIKAILLDLWRVSAGLEPRWPQQ